MVTTHSICDLTIYGILIVQLFHTSKQHPERMLCWSYSLACYASHIRILVGLYCIYNWRQFSPWWCCEWWCGLCICVDLPRPGETQLPPHLGTPNYFPTRVREEFLCNSHASPVFSKHAVWSWVCATDPFQWEAPSCFCCRLRNSISLQLGLKTNRAVGLTGHQTKPDPKPLKSVIPPRGHCALKWWKVSSLWKKLTKNLSVYLILFGLTMRVCRMLVRYNIRVSIQGLHPPEAAF